MMSHLSSADDQQADTTLQQANVFLDVVDERVRNISICNSAGSLGWPGLVNHEPHKLRTQWIRPGIALFGISPFSGKATKEFGLQPVMQFEARLIAVKAIRAGEKVGYERAYENKADSRMGLISVGYGDGYSRHFKTGTPVLLNGRRVPLIGKVSMDIIAVDLGIDAADSVGDIAILWGDGLPVEELAPWANAIPYELVCGVMHREKYQLVE